MSRLFAALLASVLFASPLYAADAAKEKADYQRRLDSVKTLTSALQRDNDAGTPVVKEALASVGARQKEAEELAAAGEYEIAKSILDEGYKKLTGALTKAKAGEGTPGQSGMTGMVGMVGQDGQLLSVAKAKADFARELTSTEAMLDAARRGDAAKGGARSKDIAGLEQSITDAKRTAASDPVAGRKMLGEASIKVKALISTVSGGSGYVGPSGSMSSMSGMTGDDGKPLAENKAKADYERKLSSASTMLDAAKRSDAGGSQISAIEATIGKAKSAAAAADFAGANQLIDEATAKTRQLFASSKGGDAATAKLKSGSASLDRDFSGMSGDEKKAETSKMLRSATSLRDLLARRSQERGIDNGNTLGKIEQLIGESRRLESSDPNRALQHASSAYDAAKAGIESLRAK